MSRFSHLNDRALRIAGQVGDTLRDAVPDRAMRWVETGAALGALKTGTRGAGLLVRRHPVALATAAVAGAGLLAYALRKRAQRRAAERANGEGETIEGEARRVEARQSTRAKTRARSTSRSSRSQQGADAQA